MLPGQQRKSIPILKAFSSCTFASYLQTPRCIMNDPVATTNEGPPTDGKSVNLIGNLLRRLSRAEPVPDDDEEEDEALPPPPPPLIPRGPLKGCLTVHLKNCRDFNKNSSIKKGTQGFLRASIGEKVKCTMVQPYKDSKAEHSKFPLCFNEWKYFSIQIPKSTDNTLGVCESHHLVVELIFFEQDTGVPKLIGKTFVKLLDILSKSQMNHLLELRLKRQIICKLEMEMVIAYGSLGYGYSHQLKHPKRNMESLVERSLFLRRPPPDDRKDHHYNVVTPKPVPYSDFIAALMYRETTNPDNRTTYPSNSTISPIILERMEKRGRLLQMHEEMEAFESSEDALQYLEKLVMKKGIRTGTPWRMNKRFKVLSKWRKKATMVSKLLNFGGCSEAAKQQRDKVLPTGPLGVTPPVPLLKHLAMQQEKIPLVNENEVSEMSKPPSPRKTLAAAPGLSTCMASTQVAQSAPFSPPPSDQYTTPPTSAVAHKASPPSSVASSSMDHPVQSRATSSPRHVTLVLPEGPATSASTSAQPSTRHIPKPTNVAPIHLTSLCVLTTLEEDGEEEDGEEEVEEKKEVHAPVSSSLLKTLSSLTLTPEMALHATLVPPHQQSRHGQLEECQPANPSNQQEECQPANPSYQPYQESPSRGKSDRDQGGTGSGAAGGVRESGWTQTEAAGMGSIGSRWKRNFAGLGSLGSGGQRREEDAPCSSTALRSPTLIDLAPPRLLGAWTENTATVPTPIGGGGGGLDWRSGGLPAAQRTSPTLCSQLISPPSIPPLSDPLSQSPMTRSPLPHLGSRATDTPSPDLETWTLDSSSFLGSMLCESNPPDLRVGQTSGGSNTDRHTQRSGGASSSTEPLTTLNSWLSSDNLPTGAGSDSGQWSLLSEIDMSPLRSGLVFSPLTPISSSDPLTPSSSPTRSTRGSKPGKERPRVVETPHSPYHRRNRDHRDYYGKM
ncbi:uncharacterized protein c2cd6 isoform X1 [Salmo salar]|uniref:Uncharacterized protein c2cd6 isoform X1 n=3 Tax=Salmo salar TaxID=8030 RepID=A0A1S3MS60_SALSA|nr:uncharacterized protein c2cd6 isoform X1 [Salmo salar]|eukprot:XP_014006068.1 PREDICTED: amyotrophic lateral sclerosis 2 chromosomal region candidate gene 11 protein isoform X1 [Salmo salar]